MGQLPIIVIVIAMIVAGLMFVFIKKSPGHSSGGG